MFPIVPKIIQALINHLKDTEFVLTVSKTTMKEVTIFMSIKERFFFWHTSTCNLK